MPHQSHLQPGSAPTASGSSKTTPTPEFPLSPSHLARYVRFAQRGGIGKCRATGDFMAGDSSDLMFMSGDEIIVLVELGNDSYLGACEGVVGKFNSTNVEFLTKLKRPVLMPRSAASTPKTTPKTSQSVVFASSPSSSSSKEKFTSSSPVVVPAQRTGRGSIDTDEITMEHPGAEMSEEGDTLNLSRRQARSSPRNRPRTIGPYDHIPTFYSSPPLNTSLSTLSSSLSNSPPLPQPRRLESKFSDASTVASQHQLQSKFSDAPSLYEVLPVPKSAFSPASSTVAWRVPGQGDNSKHSDAPSFLSSGGHMNGEGESAWAEVLREVREEEVKGEDDESEEDVTGDIVEDLTRSSWRSKGSAETEERSQGSSREQGEETEFFGSIIDAYRYSRGSVGSKASYAGSEVAEVPMVPTADENFGSMPLGAASEMRARFLNGRGPPAASSPAGALIELNGPTIKELVFPRSATDDSLCLPSARSSTSSVPNKRHSSYRKLPPPIDPELDTPPPSVDDHFPPLPSDTPVDPAGEDETFSTPPDSPTTEFSPVSANEKRHAQTYFSPPRKNSTTVPSRLVIGLPDSPSSSISYPAGMGMPGPLAWRSSDPNSPTTFTNPHSNDNAGFATLAGKGFYDDPNAPTQLARWHPKLTIPSETPTGQYEYALRSPSGVSPSYTMASSSSDGVSPKVYPGPGGLPSSPVYYPGPGGLPASPATSAGRGSWEPQTKESRVRRSISGGSLRNGFSKLELKKPDLRQKTGQFLLRAGLTDAALAATGQPGFSSELSPSRKTSAGSLERFGVGRKASLEIGSENAKKGTFVGGGIGSKDLQQEKVKLGNTTFEIFKPMVELLLKDEDPYAPSSPPPQTSPNSPSLRPSRSRPSNDWSAGDHSNTNSDETHSHFYKLASPSLATFDYAKSTISLADPHDPYRSPSRTSDDPKAVANHRNKELTWIKTLTSLSVSSVRKSKKMRTLVQAGVPSSVRGRVWSYLAEVEVDKKPGFYVSLCARERIAAYDEIEADLENTFIEGEQFAQDSTGREDLLSVLKAFAQSAPALGYIPGLVRVAAVLLTHVPAEEAFWILVALVKRYGYKNYFSVHQLALRIDCATFGIILEGIDPKLAAHLKREGVSPDAYLPEWYSTFFSTALPYSTRLRVMDQFFFDSSIATRVALAILEISRTTLLELTTAPAILEYISTLSTSGGLTPPLLLSTALTIKLKDDKVKKAMKTAEATVRTRT